MEIGKIFIMSRAAVFFLVIITLGLAVLLAWLGLLTLNTNLLGWFLLISGLIYFFGVIIVYWIRGIRFWRPRAKGEMLKEEHGDWSFWLITVGMVAAFYLPPFEYLFSPAILPRTDWVQVVGLLVVLFGAFLFIWARRVLGHFYSGHVSVIEGQRLVQHGPYRIIRHPAYLGYLLISLGISLGFSSLSGFAAVGFILLPSVVYRLSVEDRLLAEHFGDQWRDYCKRVPALIPKLKR
jgi:protein-S-isoprenylcysteine O-methyltransferase Ste14